MQKMYKGLENKIISLQQKIDELVKENQNLKKKTFEIPELQRKLDSKKHIEDDFSKMQHLITSLEKRLAEMQVEISSERDEKMDIVNEKTRIEAELMERSNKLNAENVELYKEIELLKKDSQQKVVELSQRNRLISDAEQNEIHQAYQKIVKEKEQLEQENLMLNEEVHRFIKYAPKIPSVIHSRSVSNVSSINIEDDFGYDSAKNTLELKRDRDRDRENINVSQNAMQQTIMDGNDKVVNSVSDLQQAPESYDGFSKCY